MDDGAPRPSSQGIYILAALGLRDCRTAEIRATPPRMWTTVPDEVNAMELTPFGLMPAPELQGRADRARLESFGWVDRDAGVLHIPIQEAFDLYLKRSEAPAGEESR